MNVEKYKALRFGLKSFNEQDILDFLWNTYNKI